MTFPQLYLGSTLISGGTWWAKPVITWSTPVTVTADSSAHTKGAWVEVIASTPQAVDRLDVSVYGIGVSSVDTSTLLDIGVGAASSEVAKVSNIAVGGASQSFANDDGVAFSVPLYVPSGSRIAVRIQSLVTGGKTCSVKMALGAGSNPAATSATATTIGTSTSTSRGVQTSGSTGTYVEVIASTAAAYQAIVVVPSVSSTAATANQRRLNVAVGAAGSEDVLGTVGYYTTAAELVWSLAAIANLIPVAVPAGSRLSVAHVGVAHASSFVSLIGVEALGI